jgi:hypothetical protein
VFWVAAFVIWLPLAAAPVVGYVYRGWWGALLPLAAYACVGLLMLLMARSPRARRWGEPPADVDTSDPRWRNLMP